MAGIFNPAIFNNNAFNTGDGVVADVIKTGTGGIDPGEGLKHRIVKPTGTLHLPKKKEGRKDVGDRIDESRGIQAEIAARLAREFTEESAALGAPQPIQMSMAEVDFEIGVLLRKKLRTDEEEVMLMLLMVAASES